MPMPHTPPSTPPPSTPPSPDPSPRHSRLLAALPAADLTRLGAGLELLALPLGQLLYESGIQPKYAYFPTSAIVSLRYVTESGDSAEMASVGSEGIVGIALFMGGETTLSTAVVQSAGHAYRVSRRVLLDEFERCAALRRLLLLYTQTLVTQTMQTAVCNRHHSIEQQLCRWLLMTLDRIPSGQLVITQEMVARVIGVRRESVTEAAGNLRRAGYIRHRRGHIEVLDRDGLEQVVCECYGVVKLEMQRLMADATDPQPGLRAAAQ